MTRSQHRRRPTTTLAVLVVGCLLAACSSSAGTGRRSGGAPPKPDHMTAYDDAVQVVAFAPGCARAVPGAGLTDGTFVLTAASVVAGATRVTVTNRRGHSVAGRVIAFDADQDVAWLYAPGLPSSPTGPARPGDRVVPAYLFAFTADGTPSVYRAGTLERTTHSGPNLYGRGRFARNVYVLALDRTPTSAIVGAPVLDDEGRLLGITVEAAPRQRTAVVLAGDAVAASSATRALAGLTARPREAGTVVTACASTAAVTVSG